jgi:hypothetical protein
MAKPGTWGDQVEITAFTRVYKRGVRVFSYNYTESRLVHVTTPTEEPAEPPLAEVWLLHMHGHYSLLVPGTPPHDEGWESMVAGMMHGEEKGEVPSSSTSSGNPRRRGRSEGEGEEGDGRERRSSSAEAPGEEGTGEVSSVSGEDDEEEARQRVIEEDVPEFVDAEAEEPSAPLA